MSDNNNQSIKIIFLVGKKRKHSVTRRVGVMELDESFVSLSVLEEQRRLRNTKSYNADGWAVQMPNEIWVECLRFLSRGSLEKLQVTSAIFDLLVYKYFPILPLRQVKSCTITSKKNGQTKLSMTCCFKDGSLHSIMESDSDLQLWLRSCHISTCRFYNFNFSNRLLDELKKMDPNCFEIRFCIFEYNRKTIRGNRNSNEIHLQRLFTISAFLNCQGSVFSFDKLTSMYRPSLHCLLSLPLYTIVVDFGIHNCSQTELKDIENWLIEVRAVENRVTAANVNNKLNKNCRTIRTLSVRNMEFDSDKFSTLVENLKKCFFKDEEVQRLFVLETDYEPDHEWNLSLTNMLTRERFMVTANDQSSACIQRVEM